MQKILIVIGSETDRTLSDVVEKTLGELGLSKDNFTTVVISAHRNPKKLQKAIENSDQYGCQIYIAIAGLAAHLAGSIAAKTVKPVIGVPSDGGPLKGMDALLSTVQMPGGVPVATVAIGSAGAKNAAYLAMQILGLNDQKIHDKLLSLKENI